MNNVAAGSELIFLVSQPRAGSTMLQVMLAGSPAIATTSEPWIALHPIYALKMAGIEAEYESVLARRALTQFLRQGHVDEAFFKEKVAAMLSSLYAPHLQRQGASLFLDKTPRYYNIISELADVFPGARFIILLRNPMAVLHSIITTWVKDDWPRMKRFRNDLLVAPQKLVEGIKLLGDRCATINYEDLVADPEAAVADLCRFLGVKFSEEMIDYKDGSNEDWIMGDQQNVRQYSRPSKERIDLWKDGFTSAQERHVADSYFRALGDELIEGMGYDAGAIRPHLASPDEGASIVPWDELTGEKYWMDYQEIIDLKKSLSWRITAPLRWLGDRFTRRDKIQ